MAEAPLNSNNPFRRQTSKPSAALAHTTAFPPPSSAKPTVSSVLPTFPIASAPEAAGYSATTFVNSEQRHSEAHPHPTGDEFRQQLRALPKSSEAPPSTTFINPKPVKKVRVQSPPPSSPDSVEADFEARFPTQGPALDATSFGSAAGLEDGRLIGGPRYDEYSSESSDSGDDAPRPVDTAAATATAAAAAAHWTIQAPTGTQPQHGPPPNPFQKTLDDIESPAKTGDGEAEAAGARTIEKGSLDVDAFRRLLLTGQVGSKGSDTAGAGRQPDTASFTDASSVSKLSVFDAALPQHETPRTSHEVSGTDDDRSGLIQGAQASSISPRQTLRKKPPPPSSRHGKLIKTPQKEGEEGNSKSNNGHRRSSSSSDVNKPLPPAPARRSIDEDVDSIFDREAAGKVPEDDVEPDVADDAIPAPRPPTPPNASHSTAFSPSHPISYSGLEALANPSPPLPSPATTSPPQAKRPTPAPPPRRQTHNRSDSRASAHERTPSGQLQSSPIGDSGHRERSPAGSRRSSLESTRSRTSSIKLSINAPAPPPPRRGNHTSRPSASFISPSALSFTSSAVSLPIASDSDRSPVAWPSTHAADTAAPGPLSPQLKDHISPTLSSPPPGAAGPIKLARPPPPPARNLSVRRKEAAASNTIGRTTSALSVDGMLRRAQPHSHAQPPPPPPRARGSSRGSVDGPGGAASSTTGTPPKVSGTGSRKTSESLAKAAEDSSSANHILADLDALQREVDALRGQYGKSSS